MTESLGISRGGVLILDGCMWWEGFQLTNWQSKSSSCHGECEARLPLLLMAEILHQLIGSLSHYLQGFIHPRWLARFQPSTVPWLLALSHTSPSLASYRLPWSLPSMGGHCPSHVGSECFWIPMRLGSVFSRQGSQTPCLVRLRGRFHVACWNCSCWLGDLRTTMWAHVR